MIGTRLGSAGPLYGSRLHPNDDETGTLADRDATSNIYVPSTAAQYTALNAGATPTEIFLLQESSGDVVGSLLSEHLVPTGSPLYQQSVTGWSRKGVRGDNTTANQRFEGTGPNPTVTSVAVLAYIGNTAPVNDGAARRIFVFGTNGSDIGLSDVSAGTNVFRYRAPASINDTAGSYTTAGFVALVVHDITNSRARFFTNVEAISPTFGAATSGTLFGIGAVGSGAFHAATVMYLARFQGAQAEFLSTNANAKSFLQALGWSIPW